MVDLVDTVEVEVVSRVVVKEVVAEKMAMEMKNLPQRRAGSGGSERAECLPPHRHRPGPPVRECVMMSSYI